MSLKIIIIGAGEVGYNLARELSREDYDITIVDINPEKVKRASETLDVNTFEGDGARQSVLRHVKAGDADIFLALTRIDEVNLVASKMAKTLGAKKVIARLRSMEYSREKSLIQPEEFGLDEIIYPELETVDEIERLLRQISAIDVKEFEDGRLQLVGIALESSSPLMHRTVAEINRTNQHVAHQVVAITRAGENFIPRGDTIYQPNDIVYVLAEERHISLILSMLGKSQREVHKIMILGAGRIGRLLAKRMQDTLDVWLVDTSKAKGWDIAPTLMNTMVLHGDGTDIDFLISENIDEMDSFIAVTGEERTNLVTALLARQLGAKHAIVHLASTSFLPIARRIGIDAAISKNMATVEAILRTIKSTQTRSVRPFEDLDLEALEITAAPGSKITRKKVHELKLPSGLVLGAVMRGERIELPGGDTQILPGDRVLLFVRNERLEKATRLFT